MIKKIILIVAAMLLSSSVNAQIFKKAYNKVFKYATVYGTYTQEDGFEAPPQYFVTQKGEVVDITPEWDVDYQVTYGIRKMSRLGYEKKPGEFFTGNEQVSLNSNYSEVKGLEYILQYDKGRMHNREYVNEKYLVRWISKWWSIKGEYLKNEKIQLNYKSADLRFRVPIGKRLSFSIGGMVRTHRPYGFLPIDEYLGSERIDENGNTYTARWWHLAYDYNYEDHAYGIDNNFDGIPDGLDWWWSNENGDRVADTDLDFRRNIYGGIVNDYNKREFNKIGTLGTLSAVVGADYYFYRDNFWIHSWASVMPGYHKHIIGDEEYSYEVFLADDGMNTKWTDYNIGLNFGLKLWRRIGIFTEYEITKFWDKKMSNLKAGINVRL